MRTITLLLVSFLLISCGGSGKKTANKTVENENALPPLPKSIYEELYNKATYVDYIFFDLPFSLSQDNSASIQANLGLIGNQGVTIDPGCKAIGREFFQIDGDVAYEADLYFTSGCYGYIFLKDGKPTYSNTISEEGMKFYSKIIKQATQAAQPMQNGQ